MTLTIRKAIPADADSLRVLYHSHLTANPPKEPQDMAHWQERIARFNSNPSYHLLVAEMDGKLVSSVTLILIENLTRGMRPYALIENVVTHADCRGKGYAAKLMSWASKIADDFGCYKIMLMTGSGKEAFKFYEKCGFNSKDKTAFIKWL